MAVPVKGFNPKAGEGWLVEVVAEREKSYLVQPLKGPFTAVYHDGNTIVPAWYAKAIAASATKVLGRGIYHDRVDKTLFFEGDIELLKKEGEDGAAAVERVARRIVEEVGAKMCQWSQGIRLIDEIPGEAPAVYFLVRWDGERVVLDPAFANPKQPQSWELERAERFQQRFGKYFEADLTSRLKPEAI